MKGKRNNNPARTLAKNLTAFFKAYETEGNCARACKKIGLCRNSYKNWVKRVPDYQLRMDAAHAAFMASMPAKLETTLVQRARRGVKVVVRDARGNAVFDTVNAKGKIVPDDYTGPTRKRLATQTIYFPNDLHAVNKAFNPEKFGDKAKLTTDGAIRIEVVYRTESPNADDPDSSSPAARRAAACN